MNPTPTRHSGFRISGLFASLAAAIAASAVVFACGGATDEGNSQQNVTPGDPCAAEGDEAMAGDGCNSCSCSNGEWACTDVACDPGTGGAGSTTDGGGTNPPPGSCTPGETRSGFCESCTCADDGSWQCIQGFCPLQCTEGTTMFDGCNSCTCVGGQWACTDRACPPAECPGPANVEPGVGCLTVIVFARDPATGMCCEYGDPCVAPAGWEQFYSLEECQGGSPGTCVDGEIMLAPDGCNTCSCAGGQWACTLRACAPCVEGEMMPAPDGCNTCTCSGGLWACTERACTGQTGCGGWLGDTCTDAEYCAYEEGQYCGAADASAVCLPRPMGCTTQYAPVCACDGQTYATACVAAAAGFGVNYSGPCAVSASF